MIFKKKTLSKLGIQGDFLSLIKIPTKYLQIISYLMAKYRMLFHLGFPPVFNVVLGGPSQCNKRRKQNKRYKIGKEEVNMLLFTDGIIINTKSKRIYKLSEINEFSKLHG